MFTFYNPYWHNLWKDHLKRVTYTSALLFKKLIPQTVRLRRLWKRKLNEAHGETKSPKRRSVTFILWAMFILKLISLARQKCVAS